MSIGRTLIGILLATSSVAFAQNPERKSPDAGSSGATASLVSAIPETTPCSGTSNGAQILTDTMGVDFGSYMAQIVKTVRQNWYELMPPRVYPPIKKQGKVAIEFQILQNGKVTGMKIYTPSSDVALDRAAWGSIIASSPFAALPSEFHGPLLGMRLFFFYNLAPDTSEISVSPCGDVKVPAGSTLQFSASGKGIKDGTVKWSISGPGCSGSSCGTISDRGLYTAPENIPSPPTVIVRAAPGTDSFVVARSKLTVVPANPSP